MVQERFPPIAPADLNAQQQQLIAHYRGGWQNQLAAPDGRLGGPFDTVLRSPQMGLRMAALSDFFRIECDIAPRLKEFVILLCARASNSGFEWAVHCDWATKAGLPAPIIEAIGRDARPQSMTEQESAIFDVLQDLRTTQAVREESFLKARHCLGEQLLVELVGLFGYYRLVALMLALADVRPPPGSIPMR
ncbi:MAG: hypothetical protein Q7T63_15680 [Burkholderiaceae bacterium]|nr:hypothetical protein [Burkholderiaceae bacterium]